MSILLDGAHELLEHLIYNADRDYHWVLLVNGERAGGAVLTTDAKEPENSWIKLLYARDGSRDVLQLLIRKGREAAEFQGYEWLRVRVYESDVMTKEVLSHLGFHPQATEKLMLPDGIKMRITYGVSLLPPLPSLHE